ncbi:MAG: carbonic anhydrase family protein [Coxiellaceae bacterium]|nr:carbonic anhydrase family protein [Coxiellaceae bacterium]
MKHTPQFIKLGLYISALTISAPLLADTAATANTSATAATNTTTAPTAKPAAQKTWSHKDANSWGDTYDECAPGGNQSPIDIKQHNVTDMSMQQITPVLKGKPLNITNNGHTIQVNYADNGKDYFMIDNRQYELRQIHFHTPSENKLHGVQYPLEAHFVTEDTHDKQFAVVAVFFKPARRNNPAIKALWKYLPTKAGQTNSLQNHLIFMSQMLPKNLSFYHFEGSLTTPPCTKGIQWYVLKTPVDITNPAIRDFKRLYKNNARPIQHNNERAIYDS